MSNYDIKLCVLENPNINANKFGLFYSSDPPKFRSVGKINTLCDMHDLMSKSFEILAPVRTNCNIVNSGIIYPTDNFNITESINNYGIYFSPDFPNFLIPEYTPTNYKSGPHTIRNAITWGVVRSSPGTVSQDQPFRGTKEFKARIRDYTGIVLEDYRKRIVGDSNTVIQKNQTQLMYIRTKAQVFDNLVQYNIWCKSNYEVERLTEWFQDSYMDNYIGMFREAGIVQMYFYRRVRDDTVYHSKSGYHVRSVLYYIRTERIRPESIGPINQINLNFNIENLQTQLKNEDYKIESEYDKLISKWISKNQLLGG